ncbi:hypothetical protein [Fodinibius sp.]|uniref:hypothetical protein n=1 Tax=Fodinibius sp. TaxID=1872440 RepID=UPI002ACEF251|nr:hypothetical protein [Fodinibius sp.]MDZ7660580.1 hypothetical protein [Fodinibius sp.]
MRNTNNQHDSEVEFSNYSSLENLTLIKGTFTPSEAKEVLVSLISSKISFHNKKNLRSYELNGKENQESKNRIKEFKKIRSKLLKIFENIDDSEMSIKIDSQISIEFQDNSE